MDYIFYAFKQNLEYFSNILNHEVDFGIPFFGLETFFLLIKPKLVKYKSPKFLREICFFKSYCFKTSFQSATAEKILLKVFVN